jgi:hypothetical protein
MKNSKSKLVLITAAAGLSFFWGCGGGEPSTKPTTEVSKGGRLPQDVKVTCTVAQDSFNSWFLSGRPTENGKIRPANSITFPHTNNCSFYTWSEQMFLWIVSPETGDKYTPGNTVMESPTFYDVSEAENNKRYMTQHVPGKTINGSSVINQTGPHELPVIIDDQGRMFEVEVQQEKTAGKLKVMNQLANGPAKATEVAEVAEGKDPLHHIFKDKAGKLIEHPKAVLQHTTNQDRIVQEFKVGNHSVYLDTAGNEIPTSVGQATGNVLMAQNGSLVYYVIMVNDVYAYYVTACRNGKMAQNQFPTTAAARDSICAYARKNGAKLPDSNALALELKLSLVEVTGLKNPESYITMEANVPVYDTSNKYKWIPRGQRKAKLALVGMHVVGSLAGHPEMSWATFEHMNNAPNAAYQYVNNKDAVVTVEAETGKGWLLCGNSNDKPYNVAYMKNKGNVIDTVGGHTISPSSTNLVYPFGSAMNTVTNPEDKSSAASNSEVIGINNAIMKMLVGNDLRKNYYLVGATWTSGGAPPSGKSYTLTDTTAGVAIGTNLLANSTMETYFQRATTSCFTCHSRSNSLSPDSISHIFKQLQPLGAVPAALK